MSHVNDKPARAARRLLPLYGKHLGQKQLFVEINTETKCKKGCSHCCYNLAAATLAEGVLIADYLTNTAVWREQVPELRKKLTEQLKAMERLGASENDFKKAQHAYLAEKRPCVFLNLKTNTCGIYRVRPIACQTYYVVSNPDFCSPDLPGHEVQVVDFRQESAALIFEISQIREIPMATGPLQAMVLIAFDALNAKPKDFRRWVVNEQKKVEAGYLKYEGPSFADMANLPQE